MPSTSSPNPPRPGGAATTDPGTSNEGSADDATDEPTDDRSTARKVLLYAGLTFAVVTFGLWIYALFIYDPGLMIDELGDRTFPRDAEEICHRARVRIEKLPTAERTPEPADRAAVIDEANDALRTMTAELTEVVPQGEGRITVGIGEWIDDWNTYIDDRQDYADRLRADAGARFTETTKSNRQISRAIDAFAQVNRMNSCAVPGDVG